MATKGRRFLKVVGLNANGVLDSILSSVNCWKLSG